MRRLVLVAALLLLSVKAHAIGGIAPMLTYQVGVSSITTTIVNVSTSSLTGATKVDNPTMQNRVSVEIQNIDTSSTLWCMAGSTNPVVNGGRKIAAGNTWVISFTDRVYVPNDPTQFKASSNTNFWCLSDGGAATKAAVSQAY